jgi:general stress protein 26
MESERVDPILERNRIRQLLQRGDVAMLVTTDNRGTYAGRPMLPLWLHNDPHIYFLTHQDSRKVTQIAERPQVVLTILSADRYFVVLGSASASRDPELIRRLWHPSYRAWFPAGKDDREATALRVAIDRVNYWEPPRSRFLRLFQAIKAVVGRRAVETPMKTIDGF